MPRTINDIIPPSRRKPQVTVEAPSSFEAPPREDPMPPTFGRPRSRFPWGTALVALVVVSVSVGALFIFAGAKIQIDPQTAQGTVTGTFTATAQSGELPYMLVSVQKIASQSVPAESTVTANDAASGTITIYNEQAKAQPLIKNTRFETANGLIYRIHNSVTVPAASAGKPGTLTATVYADSPGDSYNVGASNFTLPGLAGTPQASQVYAKSVSPMTGGFSGTRPSVSQATDDAQHAALQTALASEIQAAVAAQVPEGYVLIPGAVTTTYTPLTDMGDANGGVLVRMQADATAVVFPKEALARAVAMEIAPSLYKGEPVDFLDVKGLTLRPAEGAASDASFSFSLNGSTTIVWQVNIEKIQAAVAGKSKAAAGVVISGLPEIAKGSVVVRPFWKGTLPQDPTKITVEVNKPEASN
ncbi:MAG: hypothetical protein WAV21_03560 [Minisyncoccia bacterium]